MIYKMHTQRIGIAILIAYTAVFVSAMILMASTSPKSMSFLKAFTFAIDMSNPLELTNIRFLYRMSPDWLEQGLFVVLPVSMIVAAVRYLHRKWAYGLFSLGIMMLQYIGYALGHTA